jgi:hypothetical protein
MSKLKFVRVTVQKEFDNNSSVRVLYLGEKDNTETLPEFLGRLNNYICENKKKT